MHGKEREQKAGERLPKRPCRRHSDGDRAKAGTEIEGRISKRMGKSGRLVTADSRAGEETSRETHKDNDVRKDGETRMGVDAGSEATRRRKEIPGRSTGVENKMR